MANEKLVLVDISDFIAQAYSWGLRDGRLRTLEEFEEHALSKDEAVRGAYARGRWEADVRTQLYWLEARHAKMQSLWDTDPAAALEAARKHLEEVSKRISLFN